MAGWDIPAVSRYKPCPNPKNSATVAKQTHSSAAGIDLKPCCGWAHFSWNGLRMEVLDSKNKKNQLLHFPASAGNAPNDTFYLAVMWEAT